MKIRWYGQACFLLSSASGISVLLDPFGKGIGYKVPSLRADIVTVSHRHFDHDRVLAARGNFEVVSEACELRICHTGDLGHPLSSEELSALGRIDVLHPCTTARGPWAWQVSSSGRSTTISPRRAHPSGALPARSSWAARRLLRAPTFS